MTGRGWLFIVSVCSFPLVEASATMEGPCTFLQPIMTHDVGIVACPITYTCQGDLWSSPGFRVIRTFTSNSVGTQYGFENRNAASLAGLRCELVPAPGAPGPNQFRGLFEDTLKVSILVPPNDSLFIASERFAAYGVDVLPEVLEVTVRCMRENASGEFPRFKFLQVGIQGAQDFTNLEGIYPVQPPAAEEREE